MLILRRFVRNNYITSQLEHVFRVIQGLRKPSVGPHT